MHVDAFLHAGCTEFNKNIISKVQSYFKVGKTTEVSFSYLGLNIEYGYDGILVHQKDFVKRLDYIKKVKSQVTFT